MNKIISLLTIALLTSVFSSSPLAAPPEPLRDGDSLEQSKQNAQANSLIDSIKKAQGENRQAADSFAPEVFSQAARLAASDGAGGDHFGYSVAVSGDTAIIGAYQDDVGTNDRQGSAYIFVRSGATWVQQQKLTAADGEALDYFGYRVALSGDTAIVSAFEDDAIINGTAYNRLGSVYVFTRSGTTWTQQAKLLPEVDTDRDYAFGSSVAIAGDTIVVGMTGDASATNPSAQIVGAAFVFTRSGTNWGRQKLTASDALAFDAFGVSAAINGDTIILGASGINRSPSSAGLAYVFIRSGTTWTEQQKLTASDAAQSDGFAGSIAVSGNTAIIGASADDIFTANDNVGSAYIFVRSGTVWTHQQKLTASDGASQDTFGRSVALSGDTAVVGADGDNVGSNTNQGSIYVFARSGTLWTQQERLSASDGAANDGFGFSIAISGSNLIVGASDSSVNVPSDKTGLAYIFRSSSVTNRLFDFDGDGKSDVSVFRPSNGTWYLQQSTAGFAGINFGGNGDLIAPADFDGDGKTDVAVFRPSNGVWYLQRSSAGFTGIGFGASGDIPMPADYDGDGKADLAVFRPSNGVWYIQQSTAGFVGISFGGNGDVPVAADYDGDGKADVAVFRPSNGVWYLNRSQLGFTGVSFGATGDKPAPADFDGDGKADVAVFRPSNGTWYLQQSTSGFVGIAFGTNNDLPVPADYDGDGKTDVAVFRPSNGTWYLQRSTQGFVGVAFGANGDKPAQNAFIP